MSKAHMTVTRVLRQDRSLRGYSNPVRRYRIRWPGESSRRFHP